MNKLISLFLNITLKMKPLLVKILPIEFLRKMKHKIVTTSSNGIANAKSVPFLRSANPDGFNLIGNIRGEIGLGQSNRLLAAELEKSAYPYTIYNHEQIASLRNSDKSFDEKISNTLPYNINLIHVNPYEMSLMYLRMPTESWDKRYNIGFWLWELEEFPKEWIAAINLVDEIWVPSDFAGVALKKVTDKPIVTVPYAIESNSDKSIARGHFSLPEDKFLFLSMYDSNSTMERKNPIGAIKAYKNAFPKEVEDVGIVIKINNPQAEDIAIIKSELAGYENIYIIKDVLSKTEVDSLIGLVDVFVSLHRAEGFGLVLAEAMKEGTPCIATNWSSNTEFMNEEVACMVAYEKVAIEKDIGPYQKGNLWAEPNLLDAGAYMLMLYEDRDFYEDISKKAREYIDLKLGMAQAVDRINERVEEIYRKEARH